MQDSSTKIMTVMDERCMTLPEVAAFLHKRRDWVYAAVAMRDDPLPTITVAEPGEKPDRCVRVLMSDLTSWLRKRYA